MFPGHQNDRLIFFRVITINDVIFLSQSSTVIGQLTGSGLRHVDMKVDQWQCSVKAFRKRNQTESELFSTGLFFALQKAPYSNVQSLFT